MAITSMQAAICFHAPTSPESTAYCMQCIDSLPNPCAAAGASDTAQSTPLFTFADATTSDTALTRQLQSHRDPHLPANLRLSHHHPCQLL